MTGLCSITNLGINYNSSPYCAISPVTGTIETRYNGHVPAFQGSIQAQGIDRYDGSKQTENNYKSKKVWLTVGLGALAVAGAVAGIRHFNPVRQIERRFAKLYNDIPGTQKKFQDIFLRDISEEETVNILKRYEQIQKEGLQQSKEDYFKTVFEEAKKNYGLGDSGIRLEIKEFPKGRNASGQWFPQAKTVQLKPDLDKDFAFGCIHHELRHAKQTEALQQYLSLYDLIEHRGSRQYQWCKENTPSVIKGQTKEQWIKETFYGKDNFSQSTRESVLKCYKKLTGREAPLSKSELAKIPEEKRKFAKRMFEAQCDYVSIEKDPVKYWGNALEIDARFAENTIAEMITGKRNHPKKNDRYVKIIRWLDEHTLKDKVKT